MSSTLKSLRILDCFTAEKTQFSLKQLCHITGYKKTTTHRMLTDLTAVGFLRRDGDTKLYSIGDKIHDLSDIGKGRTIDDSLRAFVDELSQTVRETAHCTIFKEDTVHVAYVAESPRRLRVILEQKVLPIDKTSSGFLFLFYQSPERQNLLLGGAPTKLVQQHLQFIAENGYAQNNGIFDSDAFGVSAPIFDSTGHIKACIAIVAPLLQMTDATRLHLATAVLQQAKKIMHSINGIPPANYKTKIQ